MTYRDQDSDGKSLIFLPMKQDSTDIISRFVGNFIDEDANINNKIDHFGHKHQLILIDEKMTEKRCEACGISILPPSYGCVHGCDYFLHKCCTDLPKQIFHPAHPKHQLTLQSWQRFFWCYCCSQFCFSFLYECLECEQFRIDVKCASLQGTVYYEGHKHHLIPKIESPITCNGCGFKQEPGFMLQCSTDICGFELCSMCALMPRVVKHRYGKSEPFRLTYYPPENHYGEYICEICLEDLNPKEWYYHCVYADQFTHTWCMVGRAVDSNINYGKSIKFEEHEHKLTAISCTYDCSLCRMCREPLRTGVAGVGLECIPCSFRKHLGCPQDYFESVLLD